VYLYWIGVEESITNHQGIVVVQPAFFWFFGDSAASAAICQQQPVSGKWGRKKAAFLRSSLALTSERHVGLVDTPVNLSTKQAAGREFGWLCFYVAIF
jgi:hypothetical protein